MKGDRFIKINLSRKAKPEKKIKPKAKPSIKIPEKLTGNILIIILLTIAIVVSAVMDGKQFLKLKQLQEEKIKKEQELKKLNKYYTKVKELERKLAIIEKKLKIIERISREAKKPLRVMESIEECIPSEVWLKKLEWLEGRIKIQGYTLNEDRLADFIEEMERKPFVKKVFVGYIKREVVRSVVAKKFNLEVNLF